MDTLDGQDRGVRAIKAWRTTTRLASRTTHVFAQASFLITHYAYFTALVVLSSVVFWGSSRPASAVSYVDSLFLVVSAISGTGLNTVNLSALTTWQQSMLFVLIIVGGSVWVSMWVHVVRARRSRRRTGRTAGLGRRRSHRRRQDGHSRQLGEVRMGRACALNCVVMRGIDGDTWDKHDDGLFPAANDGKYGRDTDDDDDGNQAARTAAALERRAFDAMGVFVRLYLVLWQALGCIALGAYISRRTPEAARANGMNAWWVGVFNGVSAFNNSGLSLLDANMAAFRETPFVVATMGAMILAGNTMYPILMRWSVWCACKVLGAAGARADSSAAPWVSGLAGRGGRLEAWTEALGMVLRHPRRFHTHLFGARETWWLLATVVVINAVGWTGFELLSLGNPKISGIPVGYRVLDGLFQSISTRSGGFSVVSMADVSPSVRLLYVFMMYIPTVPLALGPPPPPTKTSRCHPVENTDPGTNSIPLTTTTTIPLSRRPDTTNVDSVLTTHTDPGPPTSDHVTLTDATPSPSSSSSCSASSSPPKECLAGFIRRQTQHQLLHDIWLLSLAVFLISTLENGKMVADPASFGVFDVVFEVVSAYGCVGVSVGAPGEAYSLAGGWRGGSKVVLCFVMMVGRHRGLPCVLGGYDEQ